MITRLRIEIEELDELGDTPDQQGARLHQMLATVSPSEWAELIEGGEEIALMCSKELGKGSRFVGVATRYEF